MIRALVIFAISATAMLAMPALAQQPTAGEQALSERLMVEIQANVQARTILIEAQRQLATALARVKELEPKLQKDEPKQ